MAATNVVVGSLDSLLLHLPPELLEKTLAYLSFDDISSCRLVCKTVDKVCQQLLNQGFSSAEKLHGQIYKEIKAKLPRRESERRNHVLARHMDLLAALETRLSLLAMTYIKYMEMGLTCFIPGKVLDEIYHILRRIRNDPTPPRPHELLTELRDISSMAMEHFEEKIVPILRGKIRTEEAEMNSVNGEYSGTEYQNPGVQLAESPSSPIVNSRVPPLRVELVQLRNTMRCTSSTVVSLRKEVNDYKSIILDQHKKMLEQDKKIIFLNRSVNDMKKKMIDQEKMVYDLRNSVLCMEMKTNDGKMSAEDEARCEEEEVGGYEKRVWPECVASTSKEYIANDGLPTPDSIVPEKADLKTLLDVLDAAPPVRETRSKRKRTDREDECVLKRKECGGGKKVKCLK